MLVFTAVTTQSAFSQQDEFKYMRSSLTMVLVDDPTNEKRSEIQDLWGSYPFPGQYNDHSIEGWNSRDFSGISFTQEEKEALGFYQDTLKGLKLELSLATLRDVDPTPEGKRRAVKEPTDAELFPHALDKYIAENNLANEMVKKWFGFDGEKFNMDLIEERGLYNASAADVAVASNTVQGADRILRNSGEQLLPNTFLSLVNLNFFENEPIAAAVRDAALEETTDPIAIAVINKAYDKAKDGWTVISNTRLYQLSWNDSISSIFYNQYWSNPAALDTSSLFTLELVNQQNNSSTAILTSKTRGPEDMLKLALYRNIDNTFAKLQKQNDVFKPLNVIEGVGPIRAKIGMKEGLEGKEKFDVLTASLAEDGTVVYNVTGSIKVDKVWDNQFNFSDELDPNAPEQYTTFKGSKKIMPGMLIKLAKK